MAKNLFTFDEAWAGGFYELSILTRPVAGSVAKIRDIVWSDLSLEGCYKHRDIETDKQTEYHSGDFAIFAGAHIYGIAAIPDFGVSACGMCFLMGMQEGDWTNLYLPLGSLGRISKDIGGYPFQTHNASVWKKPLDKWLEAIARHVYSLFPFTLALIGFETDIDFDPTILDSDTIPPTRHSTYIFPRRGNLEVIPANVD